MSTVLITGCDYGIGFDFTRQYAGNGWTVNAACLKEEGIQGQLHRRRRRECQGGSLQGKRMSAHSVQKGVQGRLRPPSGARCSRAGSSPR